MEERIRFVKDEKAGLYTMSELCERYGISRKTGYKWLARLRKVRRGSRIGAGRRTGASTA